MEETFDVIIFKTEEQLFAIQTSKIVEVLNQVEISALPKSAAYIEGVVNLRGEIVTILNLNKIFGLKDANPNVQSPIIIVEFADYKFGLMVDSVLGIEQGLQFSASSTGENQTPYLIGSIKNDDGHLIFLLDIEHLPGIKDYKKQLLIKKDPSQLSEEVDEQKEEDTALVCFLIGSERYALSFDNVSEILKAGNITPLPTLQNFVAGVINYRGDVVSVTDLSSFLGISPASDNERKAHLIIVNVLGVCTALICDDMPEVINVASEKIQPPVANLTSEQASFIKGEVRFNDELLVLLDIERILESKAMKSLIGEEVNV